MREDFRRLRNSPRYRLIVWLTVLCLVLMVSVVALVVAKGTAGCLNRVLGNRNGITVLQAQATKDYAKADKVFAKADKAFARADQAYNHTINDLIAHPAKTPAQLKASSIIFKKASERKEAASAVKELASDTKQAAADRYVHAMASIIHTAENNPLGHC